MTIHLRSANSFAAFAASLYLFFFHVVLNVKDVFDYGLLGATSTHNRVYYYEG